jgi:hypothetical protein
VPVILHHLNFTSSPDIPSNPKTKSTTMKLIHITDTYIGPSAFTCLNPATGMNPREKRIYDTFLRGINEIILAQPGLSYLCGRNRK